MFLEVTTISDYIHDLELNSTRKRKWLPEVDKDNLDKSVVQLHVQLVIEHCRKFNYTMKVNICVKQQEKSSCHAQYLVKNKSRHNYHDSREQVKLPSNVVSRRANKVLELVSEMTDKHTHAHRYTKQLLYPCYTCTEG